MTNKEIMQVITDVINLNIYDVDKNYERSIEYILKHKIPTDGVIIARHVYPSLVRKCPAKTYCAIESSMRRSLRRALLITDTTILKTVFPNFTSRKNITTKVLIVTILNYIRETNKKKDAA